MPQHLILSVISDDKPGIVKRIAETVAHHGGSWWESQLTQLAGKFAGAVHVSVSEDKLDDLTQALHALKASEGILIQAEPLSASANSSSSRTASFTLAGPDRLGIVRELSQAFTQSGINVSRLTTRCSSMPYSGDPLFEAEGTIHLPTELDFDALVDQVDSIADALALDIRLEEQ